MHELYAFERHKSQEVLSISKFKHENPLHQSQKSSPLFLKTNNIAAMRFHLISFTYLCKAFTQKKNKICVDGSFYAKQKKNQKMRCK